MTSTHTLPHTHYVRAANALRSTARRIASDVDRARGDMRDNLIAEHARTLRCAEDFDRLARESR